MEAHLCWGTSERCGATCMKQAGASRRDPADSAHAGSIDFLRGRKAVDSASEAGAQVRRNPTPPLPCLLKGKSYQRLWVRKLQTAWLFVYPVEKAVFCILNPAGFWDLVWACAYDVNRLLRSFGLWGTKKRGLLLVGHLSCVMFQNKRLTWLRVKTASLAMLMHHSLNGRFWLF